MGRVTRKQAAEIAEQLHVDEDAVLDMEESKAAAKARSSTPDINSRPALGEIEPNSAESKSVDREPAQDLKKSTRSRKGAKKAGARSKKNALTESTASPPDTEQDGGIGITPDDHDFAPSSASEKAADELTNSTAQSTSSTMNTRDADARQESPPSATVRSTRSQSAKKEEESSEPKSLVDGLDQESGYFGAERNMNEDLMAHLSMEERAEVVTPNASEGPMSPLPSAVPKSIRNLRHETHGRRTTSNKENVEPESVPSPIAPQTPQTPAAYDSLEDAVVAAATPPPAEARASPKLEDPIAAMDDLEEAVETVNKGIPDISDIQTSPEKPKPKKAESPVKEKDGETKQESSPQVKKKKAAPVVRTTKASQARISMAQSKDAEVKAPSLGRPRPSVGIGRSSSVRQSVAPRAEGASKRLPSQPIPSAATRSKSQKATDGEKKETVIPHSKPRPVSLSFPTPPPPAKSSKGTTQSTFKLPGEAVAAKLKAAREARAASEAQEAEKAAFKKKAAAFETKAPAFKARPAPKAPSQAPNVRQTNASRARESIISGKPATAPLTSHKRTQTAPSASAPKPRTASKEMSKSTSTAQAKPRPSTSLAAASKPRSSLFGSTTSRPAASAVPATANGARNASGTSRGKEVFNRAANAKATAEKEKAEKEAAAKKARAEASERGRVASREWAEKQRLKKLGKKPEGEKVKSASVEESLGGKMEVVGLENVVTEAGEQTAAIEA